MAFSLNMILNSDIAWVGLMHLLQTNIKCSFQNILKITYVQKNTKVKQQKDSYIKLHAGMMQN